MPLERTGGTGQGVGMGARIGAAGGIVGPRGKAARFSAGGASCRGLAHFANFRVEKKQQKRRNLREPHPPKGTSGIFPAWIPPAPQIGATLSAFPHLNQRNTAQ